jgi:hypothetical protein
MRTGLLIFISGTLLFLSMLIRLYALQCGRALHPYCSESVRLISASCYSFIPQDSDHYTPFLFGALRKVMLILFRRHYNWPVQAGSILQSRREAVLLPARTVSSAANTTDFTMNHGGNFLTHLRMLPKKKKKKKKNSMV